MTEPMETASFHIIGRYGAHHWACAAVKADLLWNKLSLDSPDLPKNGCIYQISEFKLCKPDGGMWRVNIRANIITECIEEIAKSNKLTAKGAIKILEHLRDGR